MIVLPPQQCFWVSTCRVSLLLLTFFGTDLGIVHAAFTTNITSDGTLGTSVTQSGKLFDINGGTIKGTNQFHSFGKFSVGTGDTASFNGPAGILNILSRVTGGLQSQIDGTLRSTIPGANLYLMNPAGVLFGPNASLNLSGSFHVTTADYLKFADSAKFYANTTKDTVLTVAPVTAFGFLRFPPAAITVQESVLAVKPSQTLSLIGGDINITGGPLGFLSAPSGRINLASVSSGGEVILNPDGGLADLDLSFERLGSTSLRNLALLKVNGNPGGNILIRSGDLMIDSSEIIADTTGNLNATGPGVDIKVTRDAVITNNSTVETAAAGSGHGGDLRISSRNLKLGGVTTVQAVTVGSGTGGDVYIQTGTLDMNGGLIWVASGGTGGIGALTVKADAVLLSDAGNRSSLVTGLSAQTSSKTTGSGGAIHLTTAILDIRDGAQISVATNGPGVAANIDIAADSILLTRSGPGTDTGIDSFAVSDGGSTRIVTRTLEVRNGASIGSQSSSGTTGDTDIAADQIIIAGVGGIIGGGVQTAKVTNASGIGPGGTLKITAKSLTVLDGGEVQVPSLGPGNGGTLVVKADNVLVSGVGMTDPFATPIPSSINSTARHRDGKGGNIQIVADTVEVKDGGTIKADTILTGGDGGSLSISSNKVLVSGASAGKTAEITAETNSARKGGDIKITTHELEVTTGGSISAVSLNQGNGGTIAINADHILLDGLNDPFLFGSEGTGITARANSLGNAGTIDIHANSLEVWDGAHIAAQTNNRGNAGAIDITANQVTIGKRTMTRAHPDSGTVIVWPGGVILSDNLSGTGGNGGHVQITADSLQLEGGSIRSGAFGPGNGGSIDVNARLIALETFGLPSTISTQSAPSLGPTSGDSGNISLHATESLVIGPRSLVTSMTQGRGAGGQITVTAPTLLLAGGIIEAKTLSTAHAGNITITGSDVMLSASTQVSSASSSTATDAGNAGNITVKVADRFVLKDSTVSTEALHADGGNIEIQAGRLLQLDQSAITTSVRNGLGDGGNISIDPPIVVLNHSRIVANAFGGRGGNISISAGVFLASPDSIIDASSPRGVNGIVTIQSPVQNLSGTLSPLPSTLLKISPLTSQCAARAHGGTSSSFTVAGRDGVPVEPGGLLPSPLQEPGLTFAGERRVMPSDNPLLPIPILLAMNGEGRCAP